MLHDDLIIHSEPNSEALKMVIQTDCFIEVFEQVVSRQFLKWTFRKCYKKLLRKLVEICGDCVPLNLLENPSLPNHTTQLSITPQARTCLKNNGNHRKTKVQYLLERLGDFYVWCRLESRTHHNTEWRNTGLEINRPVLPRGQLRYTPALSNVCPWLLFIAIA